MSNTCDLCGELEDERALHSYRNGWLCRSCEGYWTDEELNQKGFINDDDEAIEKAESRLLKEIKNPFVEQANGDFILTDTAQAVFNTYLEEELSK